MSRIVRNVSTLIRAERLMARGHLDLLRRQTGLMLIAGIAAGFAAAAVNVGIFFLLVPSLGFVGSAFALVGANLLIAVGVYAMAQTAKPGDELKVAEELRDVALADLEAEVVALTDGLRSARNDPLGTLAPGLASTVVAALLKARKKG